MDKKIFLVFFVTIFIFLMGCTEQLDFDDQSDDDSNSSTNGNGAKHSGNDAQIAQIIDDLFDLETQYDYTYYIQTQQCHETGECDPFSNTTAKISNKLNYRLSIYHRDDYDSYYLTDYNEMVARQWAPDRLLQGSAIECYGHAIELPGSLKNLNITILDNNPYLYQGEYVDCTHIVYYSYKSSTSDEVQMIFEQWIWNDYGVKLKTHTYRPPEDPHLTDYDSTSYMTNYVFEDLTTLDFAWPDPCNIID